MSKFNFSVWIRNIVLSAIIFLGLMGVSIAIDWTLTSLTIWGGIIFMFIGAGAYSRNSSMNDGHNAKVSAFSISETSDVYHHNERANLNIEKLDDNTTHSVGDTMMSIGLCLLLAGIFVIIVL